MPSIAGAGAHHRSLLRSSNQLSNGAAGNDASAASQGRRRPSRRTHSATSTALMACCHAEGSTSICLCCSSIEAMLAWYSLPLIQNSRVVGVSRRGAMPLAVMPTTMRRPCSIAMSTWPSSTSA
ncbi:hypothetical protein G6F64_014003 [Rhizopus arrhizus]|uniref:Uncharacterized protein n=1 Tax=Rhizopus oryzae TaxID=64495 RepID=A0A9P6WUW0_RHIOR|nr:hypothetical protein G6F64_014003 [Rhizopus arrhizus]